MRLLAALLATIALSTFTLQSNALETKHGTTTYCVPVPRRLVLATILPRAQRPRPDEVSLSPPALADPRTSTSTNVTRDNSSTSSTPHAMPSPPTWVLTVEDLITALFRIVVTILTLFNVNITWRIHGECQRTAACSKNLTETETSNSQSKPSTSRVEASMGGCKVGYRLRNTSAVHAVSGWHCGNAKEL